MGNAATRDVPIFLLLAAGCCAAGIRLTKEDGDEAAGVVVDAAGLQRTSRGAREPCLTTKGALGQCTGFKECYPYFKIPDISALEGWVLGVYDTCSFPGPDGAPEYGICCAEPPEPSTTAAPQQQQEAATRGPQGAGKPTASKRPPTTWPTKYPPSSALINRPSASPPSASSPALATVPTTRRPAGGSGLHSANDVCGSKNGDQDSQRIVGGTTSQPGEWPWIVGLFNAGRHLCGGSLIDDRHILTAAHCVAQMTSWDVARLTVRLGDYDIRTPNEVQHVERKVKRVVRHRGFDMRTLYNDVALLTLEQPVKFSETVRPICLPNGAKLYHDQNATVVGWGSLREGGPAPGKLQQVTIPVWKNSYCKQKYGTFAPGGIVESFLCAGQAAKDSCSGDSGGPLMVNDGRWTQVGIVSWGIGCGKGQFPGVYTRVTHFLPWIHKNLK